MANRITILIRAHWETSSSWTEANADKEVNLILWVSEGDFGTGNEVLEHVLIMHNFVRETNSKEQS